VKEKADSPKSLGHAVDYLTFVPDGEPTLDINLGQEIEMLRPLNIKIAVISRAYMKEIASILRAMWRATFSQLPPFTP